jgi:hypothetical protein
VVKVLELLVYISAPKADAKFPDTMLLFKLTLDEEALIPPPVGAELPDTVLLFKLTLDEEALIPPPDL